MPHEPDLELSVAEDFNAWRESVGLKPVKKRKVSNKKIHSVSLSDEAYDGLKFWAQQYRSKSMYGGLLSVSALLESIGLFDLMIMDAKELDGNGTDSVAAGEEVQDTDN